MSIQSTNSIRTAIVIPNFNGLHFLPACMEALDRQTVTDFVTIVVDNGSVKDESLSWLASWQAENPERHILLDNKKNLGFPAAVNRGIRYALDQNIPYTLLLNNDTKVAPDFLENLCETMERKPKAFAISSKMVKMHDPRIMDDAGDEYTILGWQFQRGLEQSSALPRWNVPARIFSACAGAAIYRTEAFRHIGLFDESHFAYLEDIDISYRANLAGYTLFYEPSAVCHHVGSGTSGSKYNSFKVHLSARNSIYLLYKNMPFWMLLLNALPLVLGYLVKFLFFLKKGFGRDYLRGLRDGFSTRHTLKKVNEKEVPFSRYLRIECRFIAATFFYIRQRAEKRRAAAHD